ncbi:hypothetical protein LOD99_14501 [Oopsacas minuta]|uniref:ubiquitinyl hydrolase 1 n=1 Tax=Oopsacas minuta TaxID=111878 RepID=A0AAV7KEB7_9METZ|nr:hypothetical protein LOD99_14501 [Oopsacas minuta]
MDQTIFSKYKQTSFFSDEWLELESAPGLFSLLLEDLQMPSIQVEEIYDLDSITPPVYGFIFLFKLVSGRKSRRKLLYDENIDFLIQDSEVVREMFFAHQIVPNSCATHSLLSVLLNSEEVELSDTLSSLKEFTKGFTPENKGVSICNIPEIALAHNKHASPQLAVGAGRKKGSMTMFYGDKFHYVSYVPLNSHLIEIDGLKDAPIDHGPWRKGENWIDLFRECISTRLGMDKNGQTTGVEIRFSLMAIVPNKVYMNEIRLLRIEQSMNRLLAEAFKRGKFETEAEGNVSNTLVLPREELEKIRELMEEKSRIEVEYERVKEIRNQYEVEFQRRTHDYRPFFTKFVNILERKKSAFEVRTDS